MQWVVLQRGQGRRLRTSGHLVVQLRDRVDARPGMCVHVVRPRVVEALAPVAASAVAAPVQEHARRLRRPDLLVRGREVTPRLNAAQGPAFRLCGVF